MGGRAISEKNFCSFCALQFTMFFIFCFLFFPFFPFSTAIDTINPNQNITAGETLVSRGKTFELGFFSPDKRSPNKSYLGIWYHGIHPQTVVWVANREKPVLDHQGVFAMKNDGNLQVMDGNGSVLWTPLDSGSIAKSESQSVPNATLQDEGNLVLRRGEDILWQSFTEEAESNTFLPGMNMKTKKLRSWKSNSDPARGDFSFEVYNGSIQLGEISISLLRFIIQNHSDTYWMSGLLRFIIHNHSDTYWISGWSSFNDVPEHLLNIMIPDNNGAITTLDVKNRLVINSSGQIEFFRWINENNTWSSTWTKPSDVCSFYRVCGDYGVCNVGENNKPDCKCLPGFVPTSKAEWGSGNYTRGCGTSLPGCSENDPFVEMSSEIVRSPDGYFEANSEEDCKNYSRRNCCSAYFFETVNRQGPKSRSSVCWTWSSDVKLKDLISDDSFVGNLKCRFYDTAASGSNATTPIITRNNTNIEKKNSSDGSSHGKPLLLIIPLSTTGIVLTAVAAVGIGCFWRRMAISKGQRNSIFQNQESDHGVNELLGYDGFPEDGTKSIDVPFFSFEMIVAATDDFSVSNKLGQGGFGPVYKGKFPGGKEIAVKRFSRSSGQGLEEFKNEVVLIAKLQHRNLVRLLGYCMEGDEKMLIYEYMPNRSLDAIVFDPKKCLLLSWEMRYNIIVGVARGLLYLHQDSRLRIVHRDLKTSNILLDEEMNPKISDFGMARIFGGKQTQANTTRVVGTYGYMSPEYAIDGLFSIKSDVFSFGVVVLEIIFGKRNTLFYHKEQALTLLGYAWKLWYENTGLDLMDTSLREDCNEGQALKCIQVALLCVQDDAADRPTMTEVVSMLSSETVVVPNPRQPIFVVKRFSESLASSSNQGTGSNNELTITLEGR